MWIYKHSITTNKQWLKCWSPYVSSIWKRQSRAAPGLFLPRQSWFREVNCNISEVSHSQQPWKSQLFPFLCFGERRGEGVVWGAKIQTERHCWLLQSQCPSCGSAQPSLATSSCSVPKMSFWLQSWLSSPALPESNLLTLGRNYPHWFFVSYFFYSVLCEVWFDVVLFSLKSKMFPEPHCHTHEVTAAELKVLIICTWLCVVIFRTFGNNQPNQKIY